MNPRMADVTTFSLPFSGPFDAAAALGNLRAHAIPGAEIVDGDSLTRLVRAPTGAIPLTVTLTTDAVTASVGSGENADIQFATTLVRRWFDLELDPAVISSALGHDPVIGPLLARRPGLRVIGSALGFETAIMTVLGQQVSLAAARTLGGRLVAAFGTPGPTFDTTSAGGPNAVLTAFPTADAIAAVTPDDLRQAIGLTGARARTLHALATACASGLVLEHDSDPVEFRSRLLAIPGIGPWTADYLAVRVLGDRDAFTSSDLVLRRALGGVSAKAAEAASEAWRPHRAYALFHLWTSASY